MKKIYVILILFFSFNLSAQNVLGEWFLHYIEIEGVQQYSTVPNSLNNIIFDPSEFNGSVCSNGHHGLYEINDSNTLTIWDFAALAGFCGYGVEIGVFLHPYLWDFLGSADNGIFQYEITGIGDNQTLQLTSPNGNLAFYGRVSLPENRLPGIWFLHELNYNNVVYENIYNPLFNIDILLIQGSFGIQFDGNAICNSYFGDYNLENPTHLNIENLGRTLATCNDIAEDNFENNYFDIIYPNSETAIMSYTITGTGNNETLLLTNSQNDYALYGRATLSNLEFNENFSDIRLKQNPIKNTLILTNNSKRLNYSIYNLEGKSIINYKNIITNNIDVSSLNSGLYFLKIDSGNAQKIIKFIKQ